LAKLLIIYSTTDGHTREICERLLQIATGHGHQVTLSTIDDARGIALEPFDKIILGASIRYGRHNRKVYEFIADNVQLLARKPNAFFSVNLVARKVEKRQPDTNPYLRKFLREIAWQPRQLAVFAGKLDYPRYRFWDRQIIRLIMWMTKGPTDPKAVIDFTDWSQVEKFAEDLIDVEND
jgi:menaquinone-dependent protoporphyrinogen oxidase